MTARGGLASHAAVVARGFGRTCVTGVAGLIVDEAARTARTADGAVIPEGDLLSVDGTIGRVYVGELAVRPSQVAEALETGSDAAGTAESSPVAGGERPCWSTPTARRRLKVLANAETRPEAERARRLGAEGIGLCRTEHMLLGARRELVEDVVLDDERPSARSPRSSASQRSSFDGLLRAMDGLPVVVRLLDPPLHEFLPDGRDWPSRRSGRRADGAADPRCCADSPASAGGSRSTRCSGSAASGC